MSMLSHNTLPAERERGCRFAEKFAGAADVARNGGVISGTPSFRPGGGIVLDGAADYLTYALTGQEFSGAEITIVVGFTPEFEATDDVQCTFLQNSGILVRKTNNAGGNGLYLGFAGDPKIVSVANYSNYWSKSERNVLVISMTNGQFYVWLNGAEVSSGALAYTEANPTSVDLGAKTGGADPFLGTIHSFKIFHALLTQAEALAYYENSMFSYRNRAVLDLPMRMADHDPTAVRTLDRSGNGNHAQFGDGSTPTTYPTKLAKRGYSFDGNDSLEIGDSVLGDALVGAPGVSVAALVRLDDGGSVTGRILDEGQDAGNGFNLKAEDQGDGTVKFKWSSKSQPGEAFHAGSLGEAHAWGSYKTVIGVSDFPGQVMRLYVDGVLEAEDATVFTSSVYVQGTPAIVDRISATSGYLAGDVLAVIVFPIALNGIQAKDVHLALMRKLGEV